jgi:ribonuclease HI
MKNHVFNNKYYSIKYIEMSKNKQSFELFLYKQNIQSKTLIELLPLLSSKTIELLSKDFSLLEKKNTNQEESNTIYIFTDGGCKNNGKKNAVAGYGVFFSDDTSSNYFDFNTNGLVIQDPSNQRAELTAILKSFQIINDNKSLFENKDIILVTDSIYCINCITKWSKNWKSNGWKTSKGEPIKNQDLIQEIIGLFESNQNFCKIQFKHVFSHLKEPEEKNTLQYFLWYGNKRVDENISQILDRNQCN